MIKDPITTNATNRLVANIHFNIFEVLLAFCAFRFFDIYKIYPVNKAEDMEGSKGVILDDIVAGIYSLVILMALKIILSLNA